MDDLDRNLERIRRGVDSYIARTRHQQGDLSQVATPVAPTKIENKHPTRAWEPNGYDPVTDNRRKSGPANDLSGADAIGHREGTITTVPETDETHAASTPAVELSEQPIGPVVAVEGAVPPESLEPGETATNNQTTEAESEKGTANSARDYEELSVEAAAIDSKTDTRSKGTQLNEPAEAGLHGAETAHFSEETTAVTIGDEVPETSPDPNTTGQEVAVMKGSIWAKLKRLVGWG